MQERTKILTVEDDPYIARVVLDHLRNEGYLVTWASTGLEGWDDFRKEGPYDLVLVDLMLPEMDGFELCKNIRLVSDVPLLIISANNEDTNKVKGLDLGADDYVTKPFSLEELSARIQSHLRRYNRYLNKDSTTNQTNYQHGLMIDFQTNTVYLNKKVLSLTATELDMLLLLAKNPFQVFTKEEIYAHVWKHQHSNGSNTVTVHMKSIRTKLNDGTRNAKLIQTVWGVGYRFIGEVLS